MMENTVTTDFEKTLLSFRKQSTNLNPVASVMAQNNFSPFTKGVIPDIDLTTSLFYDNIAEPDTLLKLEQMQIKDHPLSDF